MIKDERKPCLRMLL